jgi:primosomal protein N''
MHFLTVCANQHVVELTFPSDAHEHEVVHFLSEQLGAQIVAFALDLAGV